jgi:hypothetical protein
MTGVCIEGPLEGERLEMVAATPIVKWKVWRETYPDTRVLTIDGREDQRRDNYWDYHASPRTGLFPQEHRDKRFSDKDLVIGVSLDGTQKAYPIGKKHWKTKQKEVWKLVEDEIGGVPILVYHDPDNFTSAVYRRTLGKKVLTFPPTAQGYLARDSEGNVWNLLTGSGADAQQLEPVPHLNIYWFAWTDFYPDAALFGQ